MSEVITKTQAAECLAIVQAWVNEKSGPGWDPQLYPPGFHANGWTIALEGSFEDWPYRMSEDETITWPRGVWVEAGNTWYLGLYPTEKPDAPAYDYIGIQFAKLAPADYYTVRVTSPTDGETHGMKASPAALSKIQEILTADQKD